MSEHTTAPEHATSEPTTALPLREAVHKKLSEAPTPLSLKELAKGLDRPAKQKAADFEASIVELLAEDVSSGKAFKYASGLKGVDRYWGKDEKQVIREAVLSTAEPRKLADLKKAAKEVTKADKSFAESIVDEAVAAGHVFKQTSGSGGTERYWGKDEKQVIHEAVLAALAEPKKLNDLKKAAKDAVKADRKFSDSIVDEMVAGEQLHKQSAAANALYGKEKPKPPDPLNAGSGKKEFAKLIVAAQKVLTTVPVVSAEQLVDRLRAALAAAPPAAKPSAEEESSATSPPPHATDPAAS